MKKEVNCKTKRMVLMLMQEDALAEFIGKLPEDLAQAYREMLDGALAHPEERLWYLPWQMILKDTGERIGDLGFKGAPQKGRVEIGYGIEESFEGRGYTTEGVKAMCQWAFSQKDVYIVEAETEPDNKASQRVLEKAGFVPLDEVGQEGPRFALSKPETPWLAVYMSLGLSIGMSLGSSSGNSSLGLSLGIAVGACLGAALDAAERKQRQKICDNEKR